MLKCCLCENYESTSFRGLSLHIVNFHHINVKDYYDKFIKKDNDGICHCGNNTNFISLTKGYFKHCSSKCLANNVNIRNQIKKTKLEKYGDENYVNAQKSSLTWHNKNQNDFNIIKQKRKKTKLEKYGDENFTNRELAQQTSLQRYGDKFYTNRDKSKLTTKERYGYENIFDDNNFQKNIKNLLLQKYGVDHPMKITGNIEKIQQKSNQFYKDKCDRLLDEFFEIINYKDENHIHVKCKKCQQENEVQLQFIKWRMNKNVHPCSNCCDLTNVSTGEKELLNFIVENYDGVIETNVKKIIDLYELDIYIPDLKLAFEFNGLYWHSEKFIEKNYHLNKTNLCEKQGIHLIHIYEDDWLYKQEIVKSRILNLLGKSKRIYARKCLIREINYKECKDFLQANHIQGNCISKVNYGLFYENDIVAIITFGALRKVLGFEAVKDTWELLRYCNKINFTVVGGFNKLLQYFLKQYNPIRIITYADRSWTFNNDNTVYDKAGFQFEAITIPNYFYVVNKMKMNRFLFRKSELVKKGEDGDKSERQIMLEKKIYRIYNSGNLKYIWTKI
jgi:hypothetical protein